MTFAKLFLSEKLGASKRFPGVFFNSWEEHTPGKPDSREYAPPGELIPGVCSSRGVDSPGVCSSWRVKFFKIYTQQMGLKILV